MLRLTHRQPRWACVTPFSNQAVEQVDTRARLSALLHETAGHPSIVLRLGHGATLMPFSVRRPVDVNYGASDMSALASTVDPAGGSDFTGAGAIF
jgi:hypothetical protein